MPHRQPATPRLHPAIIRFMNQVSKKHGNVTFFVGSEHHNDVSFYDEKGNRHYFRA